MFILTRLAFFLGYNYSRFCGVFLTKKATKTSVLHKKDSNYDIKIKRLYADDVGICGKVIIIQKAMNKNVNVEIRYNSKQGGK